MTIKTKFNYSKIDKAIDNIRLYNRYKLLALNMFRWEKLPTGITSEHIENVLYENGQGVMFYDDNIGFLFLPCNNLGNPNILGQYQYVQATGFSYNKNIKIYNSLDNLTSELSNVVGVKCKNNDLEIPSFINVVDYANKMNNVEKAIDMNLNSQKFPYIIFTNSNNEFSMKTLIKQVEEGRPSIYVDKKFDLNNIQIFNTNTPYLVNQLQDYKKDLEQEILNYFGLSSTNNKRERLLVDEINVNNDYKDRTCELMFKQRQEFCRQVNEYFNLDIKVININEEKTEKIEIEKEGVENE